MLADRKTSEAFFSAIMRSTFSMLPLIGRLLRYALRNSPVVCRLRRATIR